MAGIVLIVLDVVTVAGRFYSRWLTKAGWKWDDWTILLALVTGILPGAMSMWGAFFFFFSSFVSLFSNPSGRLGFYTAKYLTLHFTLHTWCGEG